MQLGARRCRSLYGNLKGSAGLQAALSGTFGATTRAMTPNACERLASLGLNSISGPKIALKLACRGTGQGLGHRTRVLPLQGQHEAPREPHAFLPDSSNIQDHTHSLSRDACRLETHAREERQGGMGGITSVVITARRGVGVPARLPLGFSEKGLFGYRKGWLHLPLQLGRDISGLLSAEASPLAICATHQREHTHREKPATSPRLGRAAAVTGPAPRVPGLGALRRSPRQPRGPGYILLFSCPCSRMAGRPAGNSDSPPCPLPLALTRIGRGTRAVPATRNHL